MASYLRECIEQYIMFVSSKLHDVSTYMFLQFCFLLEVTCCVFIGGFLQLPNSIKIKLMPKPLGIRKTHLLKCAKSVHVVFLLISLRICSLFLQLNMVCSLPCELKNKIDLNTLRIYFREKHSNTCLYETKNVCIQQIVQLVSYTCYMRQIMSPYNILYNW